MQEILAFDLALLDDALQSLDRGVGAIEERLGALRAYLAPLRECWTGEAAAAFDAHQQRWDRAAADLAASLGELHRIAAIARRNYHAAEAANTSMWSL